MSSTFQRIIDLIDRQKVLISAHGYEVAMTKRKIVKLIRHGQYAAEVEVELIYEAGGWSPYLSIEDALKLDHVREALQHSDLEAAAQLARIFELVPVAG